DLEADSGEQADKANTPILGAPTRELEVVVATLDEQKPQDEGALAGGAFSARDEVVALASVPAKTRLTGAMPAVRLEDLPGAIGSAGSANAKGGAGGEAGAGASGAAGAGTRGG